MKKQRLNKSILSLLFSTMLAITGCSNEESIPQTEQRTKLNISVGVKQSEARGVIKGSTLPDGSKIGVRLVGAGDATDYQSYEHVCYTASGTGDAQTWSTVNDIVLNETDGTLYAYYPYTEGIDMTAIPVDMTAADQIDWMYATPITGVDETNPNVEIEQNHALANISITLDKGSYAGEGNVSSIRVQSQGFATGGTFNAAQATPAFTEFTGTGEAITRTLTEVKLGDEATDMMVIPTGKESEVNIYVTVDGVEYLSTTSTKELKAGKIYDYTLLFSSTGVKVVKVTVKDWELDVQETLPAVKVQTDTDYTNWVKLTCKVKTVSLQKQLFSKYSFDIANVEKMMVAEEGTSTSDTPIMVTPAYHYTFSTKGEHTVYVKFKDMTKIPDWAFYSCTDLIGVTIPKSVTTIGENAFWCCDNFNSIVVEEGNPVYDSRGGCNAIMETATNKLVKGCNNTVIPQDCEIIESQAFTGCDGLTGELVIPESVTTIRSLAFQNCSGLTGKLIIPSAVASIGGGAFRGCTGLANIVVEEGNVVYDSRNNCNAIMETATNKLVQGCVNTIIPQDCESIGNFAFSGYYGLTSMNIPNSVTTIGEDAFGGCTGLTGITIPESVTIIGYAAFAHCYGLTEVTIPKSVTSIGNYAFENCTGLTSITSLAVTAPSIEANTFKDVKSSGTLNIQTGSTGYDTWMQTSDYYLGYYNWTKVEQ